MNLSSPAVVGDILRRHNLRPQKRFGQNFLVDANILGRIVDSGRLTRGGQAFEIGAGLGTLTQALATTVGSEGRVVTVEYDNSLLPVLTETLKALDPRSYLIDGDILRLNLPAVFAQQFDDSKPVSVVANIPYQITSPLIANLVALKSRLTTIVLLVQKEVADRIAAAPGTDDYGAFSVFCQYHCAVETIATVPATVFIPNPKVASAILRLSPHAAPPVAVTNEDTFFAVVRAAFGQRRKTLSNALSNDPALGWSREQTLEALHAAGVRPHLRGETLTMAQFAAIAGFPSHSENSATPRLNAAGPR